MKYLKIALLATVAALVVGCAQNSTCSSNAPVNPGHADYHSYHGGKLGKLG